METIKETNFERNKIIQLQYSVDFKEDLTHVLKQKSMTNDHKKYLKNKAESKEKWVKAFMKSNFCCGMCTSSRIESKHRVFFKFHRSSTPLTNFWKTCKEFEDKEIYAFKDEIQKYNQKENDKMERSTLIKFFKNEYSEYSTAKFKEELIESTNY